MDLLKKRYTFILAGFITLLFMGVGLAWSIFVVPVEQLFGWTRAQTSLVFTVNILCFSVGSILAGFLSKKFSYPILLKLSALLIACGFFLSSLVSAVWQLYVTYGVIVGTGIGLGYNCIISSCPVWMPEKNATATGILLMGYALSTAIFGPILNTLIGSIGIVNTFRVLSVVCGGGILICSFFIRTPTLDESSLLPQPPKKSASNHAIITADMVKMPIFWVYFVMTVILAGIGLAFTNHNAPILTEGLKVTATTASLVISITSITNGISRFSWGILFDKLGVQKCLFMIGLVCIIALTGLYFGYQTQSFVLYVLSTCLLMVAYGGNATTIPAVIRTLFGNRTFSLNFSVVSLNAIPASFFPTVVGTIQTMSGGYGMPIIILIGVSILSFIFTLYFVKESKKLG